MNVHTFYSFSENELLAFHAAEFTGLNQGFHELDLIIEEEKALFTGTQESIQECKSLATLEEVHACYESLSSEFTLMKDDILNSLAEFYELGNTSLLIAQGNLQRHNDSNRHFMRETALLSRSELTMCIQ